MKTHCKRGHSLEDPENTATNKKGYRYCRTCLRERIRAFRLKTKKEAAAWDEALAAAAKANEDKTVYAATWNPVLGDWDLKEHQE